MVCGFCCNVSSLMTTTEAVVVDFPKEEKEMVLWVAWVEKEWVVWTTNWASDFIIFNTSWITAIVAQYPNAVPLEVDLWRNLKCKPAVWLTLTNEASGKTSRVCYCERLLEWTCKESDIAGLTLFLWLGKFLVYMVRLARLWGKANFVTTHVSRNLMF